MNQTGRYEYHDENEGKKGSHKYWEICYDPHNDFFVAYWGRIGAYPQSSSYSGTKALKKIDEKLGKGYQYVGEAISALEKDPHVEAQGTITLDGMGYEKIRKPRKPAKKRKAKTAGDDLVIDFMAELEKLA